MTIRNHSAAVLITAAVGISAWPSIANAADCKAGHFDFVAGGRADVEGTTRRGEACTIRYGQYSDIVGYDVVRRPSHGTLGSAGQQGNRYDTAYLPEPNFTGLDEFSVKINYVQRNTGRASSTVVHMRITVQP